MLTISDCIMLMLLIISPLIVETFSFDYRPVPDLIVGRRREDAGNAEFFALDFIGLVEEQGRKVEQHNVTTEDRYKLTLFRVPPNPKTLKKSGHNPVIYLQHGLSASTDCFVMLKPENSLVYILSDAGYDVWLGNLRGNWYSRQHETLSPDEAAFWDFSLDEFGIIDLPAMIDYTMNYTGQVKISYIGQSLGATIVLMMFAEKPDYVKKVDLSVLVTPVAYSITQSPIRIIAVTVLQIMQRVFDPQGTTEIGKRSSTLSALFNRICDAYNILELCWLPVAMLVGYDPEEMVLKSLLNALNYVPAGASAKAVYHYRQMYQFPKFRKYDYENAVLNMEHYGQPEPPDYDLSHVDVPTVIIHAQNDPLSTVADTEALISHMHPNTSFLYEVPPHKAFNHMDFVTAKNVKKLAYNRLMQILTTFHKSQFDKQKNVLD